VYAVTHGALAGGQGSAPYMLELERSLLPNLYKTAHGNEVAIPNLAIT